MHLGQIRSCDYLVKKSEEGLISRMMRATPRGGAVRCLLGCDSGYRTLRAPPARLRLSDGRLSDWPRVGMVIGGGHGVARGVGR